MFMTMTETFCDPDGRSLGRGLSHGQTGWRSEFEGKQRVYFNKHLILYVFVKEREVSLKKAQEK
jgi:hypothetical protein